MDRDEALLHLCPDGALELLRPSRQPRITQQLCLWTWMRERLYFLSAGGVPAAEFSVTATAADGSILMLSGCLIYNRATWLQLSPAGADGDMASGDGRHEPDAAAGEDA